MASFNKVLLMGNITRDPDLRTLPSGTHVCETGIATNRKWRGQDGQDREEVCFVDIVIWGRQGEVFHQYKKKGEPVLLEGHLRLDTWKAPDGSNRSKHRVVVENFQFLPRGGGRNGGASGETGNWGQPAAASRSASSPPQEEVFAGPAEELPPPPFGDDNVPF